MLLLFEMNRRLLSATFLLLLLFEMNRRFLLLLLFEMNRRRDLKTAEMYTQGEIRIFSGTRVRSALTRLVQGHLKAPDHLNFSSILYFQESRQGHLKTPNHLNFSSILYFQESRQGHLKTPNHFNFSILYFHESRQGHLKTPNHLNFFSILFTSLVRLKLFPTSQP